MTGVKIVRPILDENHLCIILLIKHSTCPNISTKGSQQLRNMVRKFQNLSGKKRSYCAEPHTIFKRHRLEGDVLKIVKELTRRVVGTRDRNAIISTLRLSSRRTLIPICMFYRWSKHRVGLAPLYDHILHLEYRKCSSFLRELLFFSPGSGNHSSLFKGGPKAPRMLIL